jgi:hypothetical protein
MLGIMLGVAGMLVAVQSTPATVLGTVRDEITGEPIAGANVTLRDLERGATTDEHGRYVLALAPAGPHEVLVRRIGYAPRSLRALVPPAGQLEISVSLRPEPVYLETLDVVDNTSRAVLPEHGATRVAWENHPLLAEPDAFGALAGGHVVLQPETPNGVHIMGGAADETGYLLDGIPVFSPYHTGGMFGAWNPDALATLRLASTSSLEYPPTLSGSIDAATRMPAARLSGQGSVSSTHAALTIDGPIGAGGAGFLLSLRSGFPGVIAPRREPSYLHGETADRIAKLELPALGGQLRLLTFDSENDVNTAAITTADGANPASPRNVFAWQSASRGAEWRGIVAHLPVHLLGWSATGEASSAWAGQTGPVAMTSGRRDLGLVAVAELDPRTAFGLRVERSRTSYAVNSFMLQSRTVVATAFAQHAADLSDRLALKLGASLATGVGLHVGHQVQLRWLVSQPLTVTASYARQYQFAQSLRNAESVVSNVFPADLYVGAGAPGVPVARSDQGLVAAAFQADGGVHLGGRLYARRSNGVVLVAPRDGEPFTTGRFAVGSNVARGASLEASLTRPRYAIVATYGLQHVRLTDGVTSYVPDHGATQLLEAGVIVGATRSLTVRLGMMAGFGRRTTTASSGLEWEACNLLDKGCEFSGTPHYAGEPLGATRLPSYVRFDIGFRKQWNLARWGRGVQVALFGTVTNLFNRRNVLTYARTSTTRDLAELEMRPLAPLLIGLDWRF